MANFAGIPDIENVILRPIVSAEEIDAADFALFSVTAAVRNYTKQYIELVADDEIVLDSTGEAILMLPELPVVSIAEVSENAIALVDVTDYAMMKHGILTRYPLNRRWLAGPSIVEIKYTHGYATIPDDIRVVTARAASRLFQAALRAQESGAVPGVVSKSLGDFAVTFGGESVTEGSMGASGARLLLLSEKDILDKYRIP